MSLSTKHFRYHALLSTAAFRINEVLVEVAEAAPLRNGGAEQNEDSFKYTRVLRQQADQLHEVALKSRFERFIAVNWNGDATGTARLGVDMVAAVDSL